MPINDYFAHPPADFRGELKLEEALARYTYYQIGGPARVFAVPRTREDLEWIWRGIIETGLPYFILGAGSNLLVADAGFPGVVIRMAKLNLELAEADGLVRAGGSIMVSMFLRRASQEGWGGLEFLTGIPGTIGGAVRMNAGTHLGETQSRLVRVEALILGERIEEKSYGPGELRFEYRKNLFLPENAIIWSTDWKMDREDSARVKQRIDETLLRRKQTQPIDYPSCGSVFKNPKSSGHPTSLAAWQVLDQLGLRGHRIGDAQISDKHSNFILNLGGATAGDVRALIELAKSRARSELGIELQEEVIAVG